LVAFVESSGFKTGCQLFLATKLHRMATETWQVHTLKAERKNFRPLFSLRKLEFVQCMEKNSCSAKIPSFQEVSKLSTEPMLYCVYCGKATSHETFDS